MNNQKQADKGIRFFVVLGMWIETRTHVPSDELQHTVLVLMTKMKQRDSKAYNGLVKFLNARGIYIDK